MGKPLDCCLCPTLFVPRNFGEEPENTMREAFWKLTSNTFNVVSPDERRMCRLFDTEDNIRLFLKDV